MVNASIGYALVDSAGHEAGGHLMVASLDSDDAMLGFAQWELAPVCGCGHVSLGRICPCPASRHCRPIQIIVLHQLGCVVALHRVPPSKTIREHHVFIQMNIQLNYVIERTDELLL